MFERLDANDQLEDQESQTHPQGMKANTRMLVFCKGLKDYAAAN